MQPSAAHSCHFAAAAAGYEEKTRRAFLKHLPDFLCVSVFVEIFSLLRKCYTLREILRDQSATGRKLLFLKIGGLQMYRIKVRLTPLDSLKQPVCAYRLI